MSSRTKLEAAAEACHGTLEVCVVTHPWIASKDTGVGNERYAYELVRHLRKKGCAVSVLDSGPHSSRRLKAILKEFDALGRCVRAKARVYHSICPNGARNLLMLGKGPTVTTIHDMIPFHQGQFEARTTNEYRRFCTRLSARKSDMIVVPFIMTKDELVSRLGVRAERIEVTGYGVDLDFFRPQPKASSGTKKVLYVGGVSRAKGVDVLVQAFDIVAKGIPDVELVLGGSVFAAGKEGEYIRGVLAQCRNSDKIRQMGHIPEDELPLHYSLADVAVFPSHTGFGLPTLEAMACGTPTVAGRSLDAVVLEGATVMVEPGDVMDLAAAITRVLSDDGLRNELSEKGMETVKRFSWERMADRLMNVYRNVEETRAEEQHR
jgi:glycosyltransferase involved in cell wall biosynthesis